MSDLIEGTLDPHTKYVLHAQKTELELKQLNDKFSEQVGLFKAHLEDDKIQNEKNLNILEKISSQVDQTQQCLDKLNNKVDLSTQSLQSQIERINDLDIQQNRMLDEHIAGVNTLKEMYQLQQQDIEKRDKVASERITELERPREWFKTTRKGLLWLAGTITALTAIAGGVLKLLEVF